MTEEMLLNSGQRLDVHDDGLNQDPSPPSAIAHHQTLPTELANLKIRSQEYQAQLKAHSDGSFKTKRSIADLRWGEELFRLLVAGVTCTTSEKWAKVSTKSCAKKFPNRPKA